MGGYLLLALGLINWQYQNNDTGVATRSLLIVLPGVVVIAMTLIKPLDAFMGSKVGMSLIAAVGAILVGISFLN
ncbi:hypothetical protein GM50_3130 [freshwater metagenome]|uniref:EamA domain-containing protein n=1 Tax=freshwater metagenome TaxID=449393 RepID=A0A094QZI7_9ZZZZ